jgi:predicted metalloprotease
MSDSISAILQKPVTRLIVMAAILTAPSACGEQVFVTGPQVAEVRAKLALATRYIEMTWKEFFADQNPAPPFPQLVAYRNNVRSGCGLLGPDNAYFCSVDKTVYFDEVFLTQLTRLAWSFVAGPKLYEWSRWNLTDGHYAAVVALAHEFGHGVKYWHDVKKNADLCRIPGNAFCSSNSIFLETSYELEAQADCYAGAITKHFKEDNLLSATDFEEGKFILGFLGDKSEPELNPVMRRILYSHGRAPDRERHFEVGYRGGASVCRNSFSLIARDPDKTSPDPSWQNPFKKVAKP